MRWHDPPDESFPIAAWVRKDVVELHIDFEGDDEAIQQLADKYGVSACAMTIRLSALGALNG